MRILFFLASVSFVFFANAQDRSIDSLKNLVSGNYHDTIKLKALNGLFNATKFNDQAAAEKYVNQAIEQGKKTPKTKAFALALYNKATFTGEQGQFSKSDSLFEASMKVYISINNQKGEAYCLMGLGNNKFDRSEFKPALDFYLRSARLREKIGDKSGLSASYTWIGNVYNSGLLQFSLALDYYSKALKLQKELQVEEFISYTYNNIGNAYWGLKNYDSALKYFDLSIHLKEKLGNRKGLGSAYNNVANVYKDKNELEKALDYYKKSLKIREEFNDPVGIATSYINIGNLYLKQGKTKEAIETHLLALDEAQSVDYKEGIKEAYQSLADDYIADKNLEKAISYFKKASSAKDSMLNQTFLDQMASAQVKYETEIKENENKLLQKENELKSAQIAKSIIVVASLAALIVLLSFVFYLVYTRNKLKQKQILDAELLRQQELRSKAVIEAEEKERVRIAKELHDGIGQQLSAAKLNVAALQAVTKTEKAEEKTMLQNAVDLIDDSIKEVRSVSHNMMPNALIKSGLVSAIREFINKISSTGTLSVNLDILGLDKRLDPTVESVLFRVLQEIINNILKHAKANTITIQLIKHDKELTVLVEDNGVGFDVEAIMVKEGGIGLKNIQSRIAYLNGEVVFDSYPGKGTTVAMEIPLK